MGQKLEETITMDPQCSLGHYDANYEAFKQLQEADVFEYSLHLLVNSHSQCKLEPNREETNVFVWGFFLMACESSNC